MEENKELPKMAENGIRRRDRLDLNEPIEKQLRFVASEIEGLGAHPLLTTAVCLLHEARNKVADVLEGAPVGPVGACLICAHIHPFVVFTRVRDEAVGVCERCFVLAKGNQGSCSGARGCSCADPMRAALASELAGYGCDGGGEPGEDPGPVLERCRREEA